jgi:hypothetical protein
MGPNDPIERHEKETTMNEVCVDWRCDLSELFSQLEHADAATLERVEAEVTRLRSQANKENRPSRSHEVHRSLSNKGA